MAQDSDRLEALHSDSTFQQTPRSRHTLQARWSKHRRWGYGTARRQQRLDLWPPPAPRRRERLSVVPYRLPVVTATVTARVPGVRKMAAMFKVFAMSTKAKAEPEGHGRRGRIRDGTVGIRSSILLRRRIRIGVSIGRPRDRLRRNLFAESHGTGR